MSSTAPTCSSSRPKASSSKSMPGVFEIVSAKPSIPPPESSGAPPTSATTSATISSPTTSPTSRKAASTAGPGITWVAIATRGFPIPALVLHQRARQPRQPSRPRLRHPHPGRRLLRLALVLHGWPSRPAASRSQLWCSTNERDNLGNHLVPDYVTHIQEGGFYGWPWYYMGGHRDPRLPDPSSGAPPTSATTSATISSPTTSPTSRKAASTAGPGITWVAIATRGFPIPALVLHQRARQPRQPSRPRLRHPHPGRRLLRLALVLHGWPSRPAASRSQLWCSTNERDNLGNHLVPDYVTHIQEGGFYGWPWYYMGGHRDPRLPDP